MKCGSLQKWLQDDHVCNENLRAGSTLVCMPPRTRPDR
jgi:hypothetical protein